MVNQMDDNQVQEKKMLINQVRWKEILVNQTKICSPFCDVRIDPSSDASLTAKSHIQTVKLTPPALSVAHQSRTHTETVAATTRNSTYNSNLY